MLTNATYNDLTRSIYQDMLNKLKTFLANHKGKLQILSALALGMGLMAIPSTVVAFLANGALHVLHIPMAPLWLLYLIALGGVYAAFRFSKTLRADITAAGSSAEAALAQFNKDEVAELKKLIASGGSFAAEELTVLKSLAAPELAALKQFAQKLVAEAATAGGTVVAHVIAGAVQSAAAPIAHVFDVTKQ